MNQRTINIKNNEYNYKSSNIVMEKLQNIGVRLADWCEKWFPDAFVFALIAVVIVYAIGLALGSGPLELVQAFGSGFWVLIPFTLQASMIIITGSVLASSPPVNRLIQWLAKFPKSPRGAVAYVAFFAMVSSLFSWGFSLIFSGLLARAVVRQVRGVDYRAIGAAAYLGLGAVWALGLSSNAALLMATKESIPQAIYQISGLVPLASTIFTWQNILTAAALIIVSVLIAYVSTPTGPHVKTAEYFGISIDPERDKKSGVETLRRPGEWFEHNGILTVIVVAIGLVYLVQVIATKGPLASLDLNNYVFICLMAGMLLHWKPRAFLDAVSEAVPATAGVLIQFPFYAGIFGIITQSPISKDLANLFVGISNYYTFPIFESIYSAILGFFIPSGSSKWILEAPYMLQAAQQLHVNLGWVVQIYNAAEALPNLLNPFWMLPLLGILKIRARELVGFSMLQFIIHVPVVLFLMWFFNLTF